MDIHFFFLLFIGFIIIFFSYFADFTKMTETALDLSITPSADRHPLPSGTDSGRVSVDSAASDSLHGHHLAVSKNKAERVSPPHMSPPVFSSGSLPFPGGDSLPLDVDLNGKEASDSRPDLMKGLSDRVAPIRPFNMYAMESFYNPLLGGGMGGLHPSVRMSLIYDSPPSSMGVSSGLGSRGLMPLTSHLQQQQQRKRRHEHRDKDRETASSSSSMPLSSSSSPSETSACTLATSSNDNENEADPKKIPKIVPDEKKDDAYWERRRKNNEAAKRSRDARRQKEEEIALRAATLEQENFKLRAQVAVLKSELARLHYMLYNKL